MSGTGAIGFVIWVTGSHRRSRSTPCSRGSASTKFRDGALEGAGRVRVLHRDHFTPAAQVVGPDLFPGLAVHDVEHEQATAAGTVVDPK